MLVLWISILFNYAKALAIKRVAGGDPMPISFADFTAKYALHKMAGNLGKSPPRTQHTTKEALQQLLVTKHSAAPIKQEETATDKNTE